MNDNYPMDPVRKDAKRAINSLIELRSVPLSITAGTPTSPHHVDFKRFGALMKEILDGSDVGDGSLDVMLSNAFDVATQRVEEEFGKLNEGSRLALMAMKAVFDDYARQIAELRERDPKVFYETYITDKDRKERIIERDGEQIRRVLEFKPPKGRK